MSPETSRIGRRRLRSLDGDEPRWLLYPLLPCDMTLRKHPWLSFSLRTGFFVVTAVAVVTASYKWGRVHYWPIAPVVGVGFFLTCWSGLRGFYRFGSLAIVVAFVALLAGFAIGPPIWDPVRYEIEQRSYCERNLRAIWTAMYFYQRVYGCLPPEYQMDTSGKRLYGWRAEILPYLPHGSGLSNTLDYFAAWDSSANAEISQTVIPEYNCPLTWRPTANTCYLAVVGPNTAWAGARGRKLSEFKDPSKTILVLEVDDSGINWAEPNDLNLPAGDELNIELAGLHPGAHALFADGHVEFLPRDLDPRKLARMFDISAPDETKVVK